MGFFKPIDDRADTTAREFVETASGSVPAQLYVLAIDSADIDQQGQPFVTMSVLVLVGASSPIPADLSLAVPATHLVLVRAGTTLVGRVAPHDLTAFVVDWQHADTTPPVARRRDPRPTARAHDDTPVENQ